MKKVYSMRDSKKDARSKELFHNRWISLREIDGYVFSHETRAQGNLVAVLILDSQNKPGMVLGRFELCPAHFDGFALTSFTGGVENGNAQETAVHEIHEEAGYHADTTDLLYLGTCRPSKSADTVVHLFAFDVNGQVPGAIKGDGSEGEKGAFTEWVTYKQAFECKDPLMSALLGRYLIETGQFL